MEGTRLKIRLGLMGLLLIVLFFVVGARLYDLQIINGDSYYRQSEKKITRSVVVEAGRGEILDRYGRKLVTNRLSYNLTLDSVLMQPARRNATILELIRICSQQGIAFTRTMPIAYNGSGYEYIEQDNQTVWKRFQKYLQALDWPEDLSAGEVIERQREEYKLDPGTSPEDTLAICAVRYEMDLREARIGLNISGYIFCRDVDIEMIGIVKERDLPGVRIDVVSVRKYETPYAAHLLGRVGPIFEEEYEELKTQGYAMDDTIGKEGAEKAFETWLRGEAGTRVEEINTSGKVTNVMYSDVPDPGSNCILTLDIRLQETLERSLQARIEEIKRLGEEGSPLGSAEVGGGAAVVVHVKTGELLAAASYPSYSLENFNRDYASLLENPLNPLYNRVLTGTYEPGSTFKMVTAAAALDTNVIDKSTKILDRGIYTYYAPTYTPMCEIYLTQRKTHGYVNVVEALQVSCNYFFFEVGRLTGIEKLNAYARMLGLGEKTGIELNGESKGRLAGPEQSEQRGEVWKPGDTIQASIGQSGNLFTPLQLANYVGTLVNGGTLNQIHLLKSVKSFEYSQTLFETESSVLGTATIKPETIRLIREGMLAVSLKGSASAIFSNYPIRVGSKTGTAQTGGKAANGIFVAFAPYEDPEIAVAIVVERAGKGSRVGVIARDIFDAYFRINNSLEKLTIENTLLD